MGTLIAKVTRMICTDWEMAQAYRTWRREYGYKWEEKFRQRFEAEMILKNDTHFFVGTLHQYPKSWIIVGLFYPPKRQRNLSERSRIGIFRSLGGGSR